MSAAEEIRIRGEFTPDPDVCRFAINRALLPSEGGTLVFRSAADGEGSPLIDALFATEGVGIVRVSHDALVITKTDSGPWPKLAKALLPQLKTVLGGEDPILSEAALAKLDEAPDVDDMRATVETLFAEQINPALSSHGGWVKLDKIDGLDVHLVMGGGCQGCASSQLTLKSGIETALRDAVPQIREVIDVTDHTAGTNPYYS